MAQRCSALTKMGTPCTRSKVFPDGLCFYHSPFAEQQRAQGRLRGSAQNTPARRALKLLPARLLPVVERLEQSFVAACAGTLVGAANDGGIDKDNALLIAPLARALLACIQAGEFEERIRALEAQQRHSSGQPGPGQPGQQETRRWA